MGRRSKSMSKQLLAVLLSLAMLLTGVTMPMGTEKAQAEAKQLTGVSITITTTNPNPDWSEHILSIKNGSSVDISNFVVKIPITSGNVENVQAWGVFGYPLPSYSDGAIILHFAGTISAGQTFNSTPDDKFGFGGGGATFGTAQAFEDDGSFGSGGGGGSTINPDLDLEYNFAKALQYSLYLYDANMCGPNVGERTAFTWRGNCHLEDTKMIYNGKEVNVSGGYHDAGDHAKFNLPQAYAASTLGIGYYEFKEAFTELGQDEHMKIIMDHFVEYFENCTVLNNGKVEAYCYQLGAEHPDHDYWGAPEKQTEIQGPRDAYFTSASQPCTDIIGETAAALAIYAVNYKEADPDASAKALEYAKALFEYAESFSNKGTTVVPGIYASSGWKDDMALASIWLYKATGDSNYQTKYNDYVQGCSTGWVMCWDDVSAAAYLYGGQSQFDNTRATINGQMSKASPQGFVYVIGEWGSARYNTALQLMGLSVDKESGREDYQDWALGQMTYLMGNNKSKRNFIVGYNENSPKFIHHRAASGYNDVNANATTPLAHTIYGALAGGPNANDDYIDKANEYQYAEVAIDYNAGFVGALAGLYLQQKDGQFADQQHLAAPGEMDEVSKWYGLDPNATHRPTGTPKPTTSTDPNGSGGNQGGGTQTPDPNGGGNQGGGTQTPDPNGGGNQGGGTQTPDPNGGGDNPGGTPNPSVSDLPSVGKVEGVITNTNDAIKNEWVKADAVLAEQTILSQKTDKDIAGSVFGVLQLKAAKTTKNSVTLKWKKVSGANKYIIYGNLCGNSNKLEKLGTVSGTSWKHSALKKGKYYKYAVMACQTINGVDISLSISKTVHATTLGGKKGNAKKVTVKKASAKIKKGKTFKIKKAKQIPLKKKNKIANHRKISYESSKKAIATVTSSGKIKAKKKGKCTIYVYAQNGICKQVKVTVK